MKNYKLKIKIVEGTIYIGVIVGSMVILQLTTRMIGASPLPIFVKLGLIMSELYFCPVFVFGALGFVKEKLVDRIIEKIEFKEKEKEDFLNKAKANGWTIVECEYTVEEWIEA